MESSVHVYALPTEVPRVDLHGTTAIVIDVLRATTTMVFALAAGAREIFVCGEVDEALALAAQYPAGECVLGGERGGVLIDGFDLGNSPASYTSQSVGGKRVIFTTTNGTRALLHCREAKRILIAGFVNLSAVCNEIKGDERVAIVCAGTRGERTEEDLLLAGAIVDRVLASGQRKLAGRVRQPKSNAQLSPMAEHVHEQWLASGAAQSEAARREVLRQTTGGKDLIALGMDADIDTAAEIDRFAIVPVFDAETQRAT